MNQIKNVSYVQAQSIITQFAHNLVKVKEGMLSIGCFIFTHPRTINFAPLCFVIDTVKTVMAIQVFLKILSL